MNIILKLRKELGMTQTEFAEVLRVNSPQRVSQIEMSGKRLPFHYVSLVVKYCRRKKIPLGLDKLFDSDEVA